MRRWACRDDTDVFLVFEKDTKVVIASKHWMSSQALKKHLVHGNCLLEHGQVFATTRESARIELQRCELTLLVLASSSRIPLWLACFHCHSISGV